MGGKSIRDKWNAIYQQAADVQSLPISVLTENAFLLPNKGTALDLACGLGGNALFLAARGLTTTAWDISQVACSILKKKANLLNLEIEVHTLKINVKSLVDCQFDVIVISRYLDRSLCHGLINALNPGGLLYYQTYCREKTSQQGPNNPEYLLADNEFLGLFSPLKVVLFRENGKIGDDPALGLRNEAQFIGLKYS
jgi:SAM-dependent methyltransferase